MFRPNAAARGDTHFTPRMRTQRVTGSRIRQQRISRVRTTKRVLKQNLSFISFENYCSRVTSTCISFDYQHVSIEFRLDKGVVR